MAYPIQSKVLRIAGGGTDVSPSSELQIRSLCMSFYGELNDSEEITSNRLITNQKQTQDRLWMHGVLDYKGSIPIRKQAWHAVHAPAEPGLGTFHTGNVGAFAEMLKFLLGE